ncbi:MAG: S8 family peptidase [Patescibacteria group bacterium]
MQIKSYEVFAGVLVALIFVFLLIFLAVPQIIFGEDVSREIGEKIPDQYIVVFKDSVSDVETAENELIGRTRGERIGSYRNAINGFAARFSETELAGVLSDPRVAFVSEDREVSILDSQTSRQARNNAARVLNTDLSTLSHRSRDTSPPPAPPSSAPSVEAVSAQSQTFPTGISRIGAAGKANKGAGVHVAVVDTGIQTSHPDLKNNIVGGKNCSSGSSYNDGNGHGTHVAGTIAALDNGLGVVGVAPQAKLWAVRVLNNSGRGTWSSVICGLDFVTSKAPINGGTITVANLSLGGAGASDGNCGNFNNDALHKAICRVRDAGVTIVVAAGNSGVSAATQVPAAYDDAVITVSALVDSDGRPGGLGAASSYGADDTFASFSNWGVPVDIGAPGVSIYSTWIKSGYKRISGTSMASPHVAGAAALYIATNPGALWSDIRDALILQGEALGMGHTDPSGKHPEPVLNVSAL